MKQSAGDPNRQLQDGTLPDEEVLWECSRFLGNVLYLTSSQQGVQSEAGFENFKHDFEKARGMKINTDALFERFWLRNVFGFIHIAGAVSYACMTFDEIAAYKLELQFLSASQAPDPQNNMDTLNYDSVAFEAK